MANQTKLLGVLAEVPGKSLSLDAICQAFAPGKDFAPKSPLRKQIIKAVGKLIKSGLAERSKYARPDFGGDKIEVEYRATAEGIKHHLSGKMVGTVFSGSRKNLPKPKADVRQRLWDALRIKKKATVWELVELIHRQGDADPVKVTKNGLTYFNLLSRAGVVVRMQARARGYSPTSNGFLRFALVNDLGPIAPSAGARFVTDHNARARVEYRRGDKA